MSTQPISAARIAANKANALKSTGPRTAQGKAKVSSNAFKHGLRSERNPLDLATDTALPIERDQFLSTLTAFMDEFAPAGPLETRLVERLAQIDLRLHRAVRMETTHLEMHVGLLAQSMGTALPADDQIRHNWLTTLAFLKNPSATTLLAQYESRLSRDFARTLTQLRQAQRVKQTAPLIGASQERAPLSAIDEKPRNQTQTAKAPPDQPSAVSDRGVDRPDMHSTPASPATCPPETTPSNPAPISHGNPRNQTQSQLQPIDSTPLPPAYQSTTRP